MIIIRRKIFLLAALILGSFTVSALATPTIGSIVDDSNVNTVLRKENDRKLRLRLSNGNNEKKYHSKSKVAKKAFTKRRSKYHKTKTHKWKHHDSSSSEDLYWYKNGKPVSGDGWVSLHICFFDFDILCTSCVTISRHTNTNAYA